MRVEVGDKVYTPFDQNPYIVRARDNRYIICTRPHRDTVLYFIIDLKRKWRAPDNMVFCSGYETDDQCKERLSELQCGELGLSQRMGIRLDIDVE